MITADVDTIQIAFNEGSLTLLKIVIGAILFGVALDTKIEDFVAAARKPKAMAVAIAGQFLLLPAITFGLTLLLNVRGSVALGMILVACCPPGNVSNILTHRAKGDVALSVSMTAVANVLAIFLMPLNFALWVGGTRPAKPSSKTSTSARGTCSVRSSWSSASRSCWDSPSRTSGRASPRSTPHGQQGRVPGLAAIIVIGVAKNWDIFTDYIGIVLLAVFLHEHWRSRLAMPSPAVQDWPTTAGGR